MISAEIFTLVVPGASATSAVAPAAARRRCDGPAIFGKAHHGLGAVRFLPSVHHPFRFRQQRLCAQRVSVRFANRLREQRMFTCALGSFPSEERAGRG